MAIVYRREHTLLSTTALLAANADLHPAIVDVLLGAAARINSEQSLFAAQGEYPQRPKTELTASEDALRFFDEGRYLPFWVATFIERAWVLILPLLTVMFPLLRIAPPTYRWQIKRRINKHYLRLQEMERQLDTRTASLEEEASLKEEIVSLEKTASRITVPVGFMSDVYHLRRHIGIVRERLEAHSRTQESVAKTTKEDR